MLKRAIIVVASFADRSRRVKSCHDVEEARRFVAGEDIYVGYYPYRQPIGQGREEHRVDVEYQSDDELATALRAALSALR